MPKRAVLYARVSSDQQSENESLPTQLDAMRSYAEQHDFLVVEEFTEDYTGTKLERPELRKVRARVQESKADALIVYASDRFTRNPADGITLREELARAGVELHYVTRGHIDTSPESDVFAGIEDQFNRYWLLKLKEATLRGRWAKARKGYVPGTGRLPYAYMRVSPQDATLTTNPIQADTVRRIFAWYVDGVSVTEIGRRLTAEGTPTPGQDRQAGRKRPPGVWTFKSIYPILRNSVYAGTFYVHRKTRTAGHTIRPRDEWIGIPVPPIVDQAVWDRAQHQLLTGRTMSKRGTKYEYLMARRLRCVCGAAMEVTTTKTPARRYYRCSSPKQAGGRCGLPHFRVDLVDAVTWRWVADLLRDPAQVLAGYQSYGKTLTAQHTATEAEIAALDTEIARQQRRLKRLLALYLDSDDDDLSRETLREQQQAIQAALTVARTQRDVLVRQLAMTPVLQADLVTLEAFAAEISTKDLDQAPFSLRRAFVDRLDVRATLAYEHSQRIVYVHCFSLRARIVIE